MTNRINYLTVALEHDTRDDDVEALISAISQLRNVAAVQANVADGNSFVAMMRVRQELSDKLWEALHPRQGT